MRKTEGESASARHADENGPVVVIIDADEKWASVTATALRSEGVTATWCGAGARALDTLSEFRPDLVILSMQLPDRSAVALCTTIRARSSVPVLAVTDAGEESLAVSGLSAGADSLVSRAASPRERVARVRALMRRLPQRYNRGGDGVVDGGGLRLDRKAHEVLIGDTRLNVPRREFEILELLTAKAGRVVPRAEFMSLWGRRRDAAAVDVHIRRLRAKLEQHESTRRIVTVRGVGFM